MDQQMEQAESGEISLVELWGIVRKHLVFIVIAVVACVSLAYGYTQFYEKPVYTSKTTLLVRISASGAGGDITTSDVSIAKSLALVYLDLLKSDQVMSDVIEDLDLDYSIVSLREKVLTMKLGESSLLLDISAKTTNEALSVAIVNQVATSGIDIIGTEFVTYGSNLSVLNVATNSLMSRNTTMNLAIGFFLGAMIGAAYVLMRELMAKTIRSRKDLERITTLPIIGMIPDYGFSEEEGLFNGRKKGKQ